MPDDNVVDKTGLTPGAQRLVDAAVEHQRQAKHGRLGVHHWLLALLERHGPMAEALACGLEAPALLAYLREQLKQGAAGEPLDAEAAVRDARERGRLRGRAEGSERDLACVVLTAAGYRLSEEAPATAPPASHTQPGAAFAAEGAAYSPRAKRPTPTLEQFGRDLTRQAQEGQLSPIIGRDEEIQLVVETLCRRTKRNPVLVGPAGVGKTAIVEGLAQRIVRGEVPAMLRDVRIIALQPSTVVAGAHMAGELEKRMRAILDEAAQDGIILFIDEMHAMIGAGGMPGTGDVASQLKPALARGQMACIGATTDDEYRRFVEPDAALERRFQPVRVHELTPEQTLLILPILRDMFQRLRGVTVPDALLGWMVDFCRRYLRNRYFPDKAVDILEQCVAYAVTQGRDTVTQADAERVAQRMVGMPLDLGAGLERLKAELAGRALLAESDAAALAARLAVTMRGLDLRPSRPNVTALLIDEAARGGRALAEAVAAALFGSGDRVVAIDLTRMVHPEDVTLLVGAPPGYVGYSDSLPLHRVAQMPWCVLLLENVGACHPQIRALLAQALGDGFFTDGRGKRIYLSDCTLLLTAGVALTTQRRLGFGLPAGEAPAQEARAAAEEALGPELVAEADLVCAAVPTSADAERCWLKDHLLADLAARYRREGVQLTWDDSVVDWLLAQRGARGSQRDWERLVDECVSPLLVAYLPAAGAAGARSLRVRVQGGSICIDTHEAQGGS